MNKGIKQPKPRIDLDGQYPGINGISWSIGFMEQFLSVVSEPLLIGCASIAVIDFITGGHLMEIAFINYLWAASLAIAVTACFIVTWRRSIKAFSNNHYGTGFLLAVLGTVLGLVDFSAIAVQSMQQTLGIRFVQALTMLNLNLVVMTYIRAGVSIAMAVVVAVSNNTAVSTAQAPKRRLMFLDKALDKIAPVVDSHVQVDEVVSRPEPILLPEKTVRMKPYGQRRPKPLTSVPERIDRAERIKAAIIARPNMSDRQIAALLKVSPTTVGKYRRLLDNQSHQSVQQ